MLTFLALEQMRSDEEIGELVEAQMFSYFEEVMKVPSLRDWLNWSDEEKKFLNTNKLRELYVWMLGDTTDDSEEGDRESKKLPEAKSVRRLGKFIEDETALAIFRAPGGTLERAESRYEADHQQEWQSLIVVADDVLSSLSVKELRLMKNDDIDLLNQLQKRIIQTFKDREAILSTN